MLCKYTIACHVSRSTGSIRISRRRSESRLKVIFVQCSRWIQCRNAAILRWLYLIRKNVSTTTSRFSKRFRGLFGRRQGIGCSWLGTAVKSCVKGSWKTRSRGFSMDAPSRKYVYTRTMDIKDQLGAATHLRVHHAHVGDQEAEVVIVGDVY